MRSSFAGYFVRCYSWLTPAKVLGVQNVDIVVIGGTITSAEDDKFLSYGCACHCTQWDGDVSYDVG